MFGMNFGTGFGRMGSGRRASGGTPTPTPGVFRTPEFYDAFAYTDGTRIIAGDANANAGQVATNPGNLGWDALLAGSVSTARFNIIVYQGKATARTANFSFASTYLLSPPLISISGDQYGRVAGPNATNGEIAIKGTNEANLLYLRNNGSVVNAVQLIAGTPTTVMTVTGSSTRRLLGGVNGAFSLPTRSDEVFTITTVGTTAFVSRGPGFPLGTPTGYSFTDPGGTRPGFRSIDTNKNLDSVEYGACATKIIIDESSFNGWYPKVKEAAGDPITSGSATFTLSGTYVGVAPTALQFALADPITGALCKAWAWVVSATIGGGTWSATIKVPVGLNGRNAYAIGIAAVDSNDKVLGGSEYFAIKWCYVALNIALIGQSNSGGLTNTMTSGNYADFAGSATYQRADPQSMVKGSYNDCTGYYTSTTNQTSDKMCARLGDMLSTQLNIPVCFEVMAISANGAGNLNPASGVNATYLQTHHAFAGGAFEMLYLSQGENEVSSSGSSWLTQWVDTNLPVYLAMSGQPTGTEIPIFQAWTGRVTGSNGQNTASTKALREGQDAFVAYANAQLSDVLALPSHHYVGAKMVDAYHYTAILGEGYDEVSRRIALSVMKHLGASAYDGMGPIATTATRSGAVITIDFDLNGATSLTCLNGEDQSLTGTATALTSWEVSTDDFATNKTISSAQLVGNQVVITLSADPGGPVKVRNHYGFAPTITSWAFGAYADGSYIGSKPIITPLVSN